MNILECVYDLVEFALSFQSTMRQLNEAHLNFAFELRMGLNFGPVAAGVIGTTKLFYEGVGWLWMSAGGCEMPV
ncbi:unnamed protein product [Rotaria sp. Silwood2]|nr:unnamed protein product [Rotaria sp. Silwood2]CAF4362544.1 unnamed protein product [Rotaria sp. Silwood2]